MRVVPNFKNKAVTYKHRLKRKSSCDCMPTKMMCTVQTIIIECLVHIQIVFDSPELYSKVLNVKYGEGRRGSV